MVKRSKTLCENAIAMKVNGKRRTASDEEIDLAIAFLRGKVGVKQVATIMHFTRGNVAHWVCGAVREALKRGKLK